MGFFDFLKSRRPSVEELRRRGDVNGLVAALRKANFKLSILGGILRRFRFFQTLESKSYLKDLAARKRAAECLAEIGGSVAAGALIRWIYTDIGETALQGLKVIGDERALQPLVDELVKTEARGITHVLYSSKKDIDKIRSTICAILDRIGPAKVTEVLSSAVRGLEVAGQLQGERAFDKWATGHARMDSVQIYTGKSELAMTQAMNYVRVWLQAECEARAPKEKRIAINGQGGAKAEIQSLMRKHVDGIKAKARNEPGYSVTEKRWEGLFSSDVIAFTTDTALRLVDETIRDGKHHVQSKTFDNIYVAVSVVPSIDDKKSMRLFAGGYFQVFDGLLKESGWLQSDRDFAHWIYCYEGRDKHKAHLTFIPAKSLTNGPSVWIFAQDLMTSEEKSRAGVK